MICSCWKNPNSLKSNPRLPVPARLARPAKRRLNCPTAYLGVASGTPRTEDALVPPPLRGKVAPSLSPDPTAPPFSSEGGRGSSERRRTSPPFASETDRRERRLIDPFQRGPGALRFERLLCPERNGVCIASPGDNAGSEIKKQGRNRWSSAPLPPSSTSFDIIGGGMGGIWLTDRQLYRIEWAEGDLPPPAFPSAVSSRERRNPAETDLLCLRGKRGEGKE